MVRQIIECIEKDIINIAYHKVSLEKKSRDIAYDFKTKKADDFRASFFRNLKALDREIWGLVTRIDKHKLVELINLNQDLNIELEKRDMKGMLSTLNKMKPLLKGVKPAREESISFRIPELDSSIREEINVDIREMEKCYNHGCYRSVIIICGRILETVLHRKYYELTGIDILEKNPGIGLGTLIAKLREKNARFDPGLAQQIHLINQVRIFSVHKKQEAFYPSKEQAYATILYTIDSLNKLLG